MVFFLYECHIALACYSFILVNCTADKEGLDVWRYEKMSGMQVVAALLDIFIM